MIGDLKLLAGNSQWRIVFLFNILLLTAVVTRGSATMYYVKYVLLRPELVFAFIVSGMVASLTGHYYLNVCWGNLTASAAYQWTIISFVIFGSADFSPAAFADLAVFGLNIII